MVKKVKTEPPPGCIPEAEQPYKVPKNWRWVNVGSLSTYHRGVSYNKDDVHSVKHENDILILRGGNISEGVIDITADSVFVDRSLVNDNQILKKHDIVIVSSTGSKRVIGRAGISDRDYSDVAFGAFLLVVRPSYGVYPQYLDYFFLGDSYRNRIRELAKGTNINNIRTDYITQTPIPLPPLPEQRRIVDRIESLFTKLDAARAAAQSVVDEYELRRSAILYRAFTGELTAGWREKKYISLDNWVSCTLADIFDMKAGKNINADLINPEQSSEYPYPCFGGNGIRGYVAVSNQDGEHPLIGRQGALCGNINYASGKFYATEHAVVVSYKKETDTIWAMYYLEFLNLNQYATATAQPGLAVKKIEKIPAKCPSIAEQKEIASHLKYMLKSNKCAKQSAEAVIETINTMKKSILARAFRGELGTNDPAEEIVKVV